MHCVKNVRIRSYSGPFSFPMQENTDQNSYEYGQFLRSNDGSVIQTILYSLHTTS